MTDPAPDLESVAQTTLYPNQNALWAAAIVQELAHSGVRHVCVSPGSRSTPLALAAAQHTDVQLHVHLDERVAGFFALGLARARREPVALVCTSGSAGAHYLPALIEAYYSRVALVAITADRPAELMDCGAGQTITQPDLFGPHVRQRLDLQTPHLDDLSLRHLRQAIDRVAAAAQGHLGHPPGPVHINAPMREPLEPSPRPDHFASPLAPLSVHGRARAALLSVQGQPAREPNAQALDALHDALRASQRPLIVVGPVLGHALEAEPVLELARRLGAPLLADPLSGLRWAPDNGRVVLGHYDAFLRSEPWRQAHSPDVILRLGMMPTSKAYRLWREAHPEALEFLVDPFGQRFDPTHQAHALLVADATQTARALLARAQEHVASAQELTPRAPWRDALWRAEQLAAQLIESALSADDALWEGYVARMLMRALPAHATLCVASSMPIRDLDALGGVLPQPVQVLSSRGANGIDGLNATALGVAAALGPEHEVTSLIGDVAFFHDVGGLMAAAQRATVTFVVINNGGGGIFAYLPIAQHPEHFERLFLTPPTAQIEPIARGFGLDYTRVATRDQLIQALVPAPKARSRVIEVIVDREDNVRRHQALWRAITRALEVDLG